jgi:hypothetical protein
VNGPADDAEFQRRMLDTAWHDTRQQWTDGGATHFEIHHRKRIDDKAIEHVEALRRLQELLIAAEQATEY